MRLIDSSTDYLTIEADVPAPAILLVTDTYAKGWRAYGLPGSVQQEYKIMPANWCLRAVPLAAGHHRLRMEYLPSAFIWGKWISLISIVGFCFLLGIWFKRYPNTASSLGKHKRGNLQTS